MIRIKCRVVENEILGGANLRYNSESEKGLALLVLLPSAPSINYGASFFFAFIDFAWHVRPCTLLETITFSPEWVLFEID